MDKNNNCDFQWSVFIFSSMTSHEEKLTCQLLQNLNATFLMPPISYITPVLVQEVMTALNRFNRYHHIWRKDREDTMRRHDKLNDWYSYLTFTIKNLQIFCASSYCQRKQYKPSCEWVFFWFIFSQVQPGHSFAIWVWEPDSFLSRSRAGNKLWTRVHYFRSFGSIHR